ncbi:MAG: MerR family DNA-binding transcriptional regulator [Lachnospiraceae bacterium]|nr:MerR family DNA-binding transcriptional regulator [Lachnospiraceae bacterium]
MEGLIKIREISSKYDISARALRYYEDMGLISSTRSSDYAYRLYDRQKSPLLTGMPGENRGNVPAQRHGLRKPQKRKL